MTHRGRKRLLWVLNTAMAACVLVLVCWAVGVPPEMPRQDSPAGHHGAQGSTSQGGGLLARDAYSVIHDRPLRQILIEPALPPPPPPPPPPKVTVKLIGTAMDPGFICGFFRLTSGRTETVMLGQKIDGAELIEVTKEQVKLKIGEQVIVLTADDKGKGGGG